MVGQSSEFKLILGTPLSANPRPWIDINVDGVMVNAYEILKRGIGEFRGKKLREYLGINDEQELWIDSGGYQFLRRGENINVEKLAKIYKEVDADYYVSLDYPPSPKIGLKQRALFIAKTVNAYLKLRTILRDITEEGRLVPVFHMATGNGLKVQLACYQQTSIVAGIGGLVPYFMQRAGQASRRKAVYFLRLIRGLWDGRLHALGLASASIIPLLRVIGIDSSDTQTWRHKAAYGKIILPGIGERHITGREISFGPAKLQPVEEEVLNGFLEKTGRLKLSTKALRSQFAARAKFNAYMLSLVAQNSHTYVGKNQAFANLYKEAEIIARLDPYIVEQELAKLLQQEVSETINNTLLV